VLNFRVELTQEGVKPLPIQKSQCTKASDVCWLASVRAFDHRYLL